jgi:lipoate-protein ligase A
MSGDKSASSPPFDLLVTSDLPASARECMARDVATIGRCADGVAVARVYEWAGPAVSLGRSNDAGRIDAGILAACGIALVRRPTGGAALVHGTDVSYSVSVPRNLLAGRGIGLMETGRLLASPVLEGLRSMGIDARFRSPDGASVRNDAKRSDLCFLQKSFLDIMVGDRKIAAFAQRATSGTVFQHGSVLVEPVPPEIIETLIRAGLGSAEEWESAAGEIAVVGGAGRPGRDEVRKAILAAAGTFPRSG